MTDNQPSREALSSPVRHFQRKPVQVSVGRLVTVRPFDERQSRPIVIEPVIADLDVTQWVASNRSFLDEALVAQGALLLRGFAKRNVAGFERFVSASSGPLLEYGNRSTPRSRVEGRIFTSTEYPADQSIPQHNELSYTRAWPSRVCFSCVVTPQRGGETPIADSRRVFERIPASIRERFERDGVCYVRNHGQGIDLPWQDVFQTSDPVKVDRYCGEHGIKAEWLPEGRLRTSQVCQATTIHPRTGEVVWFNQANLFHVSALPTDLRVELEAQFAPQDLPRNAFYGDGSPIELEVLDEIRAAYATEEVVFRWEEGDILLLDNVLMAHGRRPFVGPRRIVVGMT